MKTYEITGSVSLSIRFKIQAETEKDALETANELITEYYRLDVKNAVHNSYDVNINAYDTL